MDTMPVNPATVQSLESLSGPNGRDFLQSLVEAYLSDTQTRLLAMREEVRNGDAARLARIAHSVMGSSLSMGAEALAAQMRGLVVDGRSGILPGPDRLRSCDSEFIRVKTALLALLAR